MSSRKYSKSPSTKLIRALRNNLLQYHHSLSADHPRKDISLAQVMILDWVLGEKQYYYRDEVGREFITDMVYRPKGGAKPIPAVTDKLKEKDKNKEKKAIFFGH